MTAASARNHYQPLAIMMRELVDAFVAAKTAQVDISRALYAVNSDLNCADIVRRYYVRSLDAVQTMLATVTDFKINDVPGAAATLVFAITGPMKEALEAGAPPKMIEDLRHHLYMLAVGYLKEVAEQSSPTAKAQDKNIIDAHI